MTENAPNETIPSGDVPNPGAHNRFAQAYPELEASTTRVLSLAEAGDILWSHNINDIAQELLRDAVKETRAALGQIAVSDESLSNFIQKLEAPSRRERRALDIFTATDDSEKHSVDAGVARIAARGLRKVSLGKAAVKQLSLRRLLIAIVTLVVTIVGALILAEVLRDTDAPLFGGSGGTFVALDCGDEKTTGIEVRIQRGLVHGVRARCGGGGHSAFSGAQVGESKKIACPPGQHVVGVYGRAAAAVDQVGIVCGAKGVPPKRVDHAGGNGGDPFSFNCPNSFAARIVTRSGALVDAVGAECVDL